MTNKKSTKKALLSSMLSLMLCFAMLIGTTFAWFTDNVTSGGNKIQAGTLEVKLYHSEDASAWNEITDSSEPIFNYDNWEPGYTDVNYLKVENAGTLALYWQAELATNVQVTALANVIDVYVIANTTGVEKANDFATISSSWSKAGTLSDFIKGFASKTQGSLLAGEFAYLGIALHMQETAGNEYQAMSLGGEFDIIIRAIQQTYEKDSFDEKYDEMATFLNKDKDGNWVISNVGELRYFASQVNAGNRYSNETVKLVADIDMKGVNWKPAGNVVSYPSITFAGTFDGDGHTISNLNTLDYTTNYATAGFFGSTSGATIKDVTFKNATVKSSHYAGVVVGYEGAESAMTTIENVIVDGANVTTAAEKLGTKWDNGDKAGGIAGYAVSMNIKGCTVKNSTITGYRDIGGILGYGSTTYNTVSVDSCAVENSTIGCDYTHNYKNYTTADEFDIAEVLGDGGATLTNNTVTNVTVNAFSLATSPTDINDALYDGNNVALSNDISAPLSKSAIYGTPTAVVQKNGGVIDGNGYSLDIENPRYEGYAIETYGGTIKNLTIDSTVGRGIVISSPQEDVYIDHVVIDGPGYAINTTEHNGKKLHVTNSVVNGWTSFAGLDSASWTNCTFGENTSKYWQGMGYDQDYDRLIRPYGNTTFTNCMFEKGFYIDLSALGAGRSITLTNSTCDGVVLTADNYSDYITIELPSGRTLAECVVFG